MKVALILVVLLLETEAIFSQTYVVLKNDSIIRVRKIRYDAKSAIITLPEKNSLTIPQDKIEAIVSEEDKRVTYRRKVEAEFMSLTRIEDGEVNLYEDVNSYTVYGGVGGPMHYRSTTWYVEKQGQIYRVPSNWWMKREGKKDVMKSWFSESPTVIEKIEGDTVKFSDSKLRNLIVEFNLVRFGNDTAKRAGNEEMIDVIFYTNEKKLPDSKLFFRGRDYRFSKMFAATIPLPSLKLAKVCLRVNDREYCTLVRAYPGFQNFYEIVVEDEIITTRMGLR